MAATTGQSTEGNIEHELHILLATAVAVSDLRWGLRVTESFLVAGAVAQIGAGARPQPRSVVIFRIVMLARKRGGSGSA